MSVHITAILGLAFLGLSVASTFLMFQFWGYPYDETNRRSSCPQWKMNIHRGVGYAYLALYLILMWKMLPRLWEYQVEFAPRTVVHMMLGVTIGVILIVKISILRWFRHFEEWMPVLGVLLMLCTFLLVFMSVPFVLKERAMAAGGDGGSAFSDQNRARVAALMKAVDLPEGANVAELSSERSLRRGRDVLLDECTHCHDLKTAISRPRVPADWYRTVRRMAVKPNLGAVLDEREQLEVTAYLVAITPKIQTSAKEKRIDSEKKQASREAATEVTAPEPSDPTGDAGPPREFDSAAAKEAYEFECAMCHELSDVDADPPGSEADVDDLLKRMVENGLEVETETLELIRSHLMKTFVEKSE